MAATRPTPSHVDLERLRAIKSFPQLVKYLRDDLDWPIESDAVEDLTYEYTPDELGLDAKSAVKIKEIKQLRPLASEPWGIFFVNFEPKKLPVVVLRRVLRALVVNKRGDATKAERAAWDRRDLLFISAYGAGDDRAITFAHFADPPPGHWNDLPTLKVLGWDDQDTVLHLDKVDRDLRAHLRWPSEASAGGAIDPIAWRASWSKAFTVAHGEVVRTSKDLAMRLAVLAGRIRTRARTVIRYESEKGELKTLHKAFREAIIHDLTEDDFADMYAQTISYGLLTAAVSRHSPDVPGLPVSADSAVEMVPITNPFLKEMLERFLKAGGRSGKAANRGIDFDELGVSEVVDLLRTANMDAVLRDFGNRNPLEDPVIHFYELFLKEYDPKKRMQRGVFYTPRPVVSFIVRSVHEILQKEFGLADGLADTATWGWMLEKNPGLKLPTRKVSKPGVKDLVDVPAVSSDDAFIQILDPATGTGTFLVEVIEVIHQTLTAKWTREGKRPAEIVRRWNEYVPAHLLPRLHGYELMPAPYAIAHMKIGLKLQETGYGFGSEERVRVYLTNALEPAEDFSDRLEFDVPELANEARAVNAVKRSRCFNTIIGNPPYSNFGQLNRIPFIMELLESYKEGLNEKKLNLDDDCIKFLRFAQFLVESAGCGVVGFITNNTYFDGITHRQMRRAIRLSMSTVQVLDLHGSSLKKEMCPDGSMDENVFDIQQGVGISLWHRCGERGEPAAVYHRDVWGSREAKTKTFVTQRLDAIELDRLTPQEPYEFFVPKDFSLLGEYRLQPSLVDIFSENGPGVKTERDGVSIHWDKPSLRAAVQAFRENSVSALREQFGLGPDSRDWKVANAKADVIANDSPKCYTRILYRPFDLRHIWYSGQTRGFVGTPGYPVMRNMLKPGAIGLLGMRQFEYDVPSYCYVFVARAIIDNRVFVSNRGIANLFPLYVTDAREGEDTLIKDRSAKLNLSESFVAALARALDVKRSGGFRMPDGVAAEDVLAYAYAILHSPRYRERYAPFLKIEFPRVHMTGNRELFKLLVGLGHTLVSHHLLEAADAPPSRTSWIGEKASPVDGVWYSHDTVWLDKAQTRGFHGVPKDIWNFHIGGYQVCEKWLKDRKGRMLSKEDIEHYQKIVVAISETIRIMGEIDQVIDAHGGWPGAFITDPVELEKLGLKSSASVPPVSPRDNRGSSSEAGEPSLPFA